MKTVLGKMSMYSAPFTEKRGIDFFLNPGKKEKQEMIDAIRQDLSRFLPPRELATFETREFSDFFDALKSVFASLKGMDLTAPEEEA